MANVVRFNPDAYVIVHVGPHSDVLRVTTNVDNEDVAKMYAESVEYLGGHVIKICKAGVLVAALELVKEHHDDTTPTN